MLHFQIFWDSKIRFSNFLRESLQAFVMQKNETEKEILLWRDYTQKQTMKTQS